MLFDYFSKLAGSILTKIGQNVVLYMSILIHSRKPHVKLFSRFIHKVQILAENSQSGV